MIKKTLAILAFVAGIFVSMEDCEFYCCGNPASAGVIRIKKSTDYDSEDPTTKEGCVAYDYVPSHSGGWSKFLTMPFMYYDEAPDVVSANNLLMGYLTAECLKDNIQFCQTWAEEEIIQGISNISFI